MGILASSPELANVVRSRMGQPVQMANGGQNVTNYMSAIRDLAARGDKATLNNIARDQRLPRSVQMAAANALTGRTVPGQVPTVSDAERMAANRSNLAALRAAQGLGQGATVPMSGGITNTTPAIDARSNLAAFRAAQGLDQGANTDFGSSGSSSSSTTEAPLSEEERMAANRSNLAALRASTPAGLKRRSDAAMGLNDDPYLNEDGSERLFRDPITGNLTSATARNIDASISARLSDDVGPPKTEAEKLAEGPSTFGAARSVSTLDPGAQKEADATLPETTIDPATQDPGVRAGITGTEPPKKVKKKKTAVETALDIALENETADAQAEKTVIGAKTNENINAAIASALETQQSNATDKEKAEKLQALIDANQDKHIVKNREAIESLKNGK